MKQLIFAFVVLAAVGQEASAQSLNAMTWNIRYNNPDDGVNAWPNRKDWVAEINIKNNVDIAGFQEVLVGQLEDLKVRPPEMDIYGVGRDDLQEEGRVHKVYCASSDHEDGQHILRSRPDVTHVISSAFTYSSAGATLK